MMIQIGTHRLMIGDITTDVVSQLMGAELADVIYSDPPWGPGNQQYWHTMRSRGSVPRTSWPGFLAAFCGVCAAHRKPDAPVFVEMGMRWADELDSAMIAVGLPRRRRWVVTYGPKKKPLPVTLNLYGPRDIDVVMPEPAHGEPVTRAVLEVVVRPGALVLDPCTGLGMTARITHKLGASFRGTEMNANRLETTLAWLRKAHR
jgi:hypothetical protein